MTKYRRMIFAKQNEARFLYPLKLFWFDVKNYFYGALAGILIAILSFFYVADAHAADAKLVIDILECESSGRYDVYSRSKKHYGVAQFRKDTFYMFIKKGKFPRSYYHANPIHQMRVLNWALDHGLGHHWQCLPPMDSVRAEK